MQKQIASATSKSGMCVRQPFLKKKTTGRRQQQKEQSWAACLLLFDRMVHEQQCWK
jgi:hypothetical protein